MVCLVFEAFADGNRREAKRIAEEHGLTRDEMRQIQKEANEHNHRMEIEEIMNDPEEEREYSRLYSDANDI